MLLVLLIAVPCIIASYLLRWILPESMWNYALAVLSIGLTFCAGWYSSIAERYTPYERELDETIFPLLLFFLSVLLPVYAMNRIFHSPINPHHFSSVGVPLGFYVVFRIGHGLEGRLNTPQGGVEMILAIVACIVVWVVAIFLKSQVPPEQMEIVLIVLIVILSAILGGLASIFESKPRQQSQDSVSWKPPWYMLWSGAMMATYFVAEMVRLPDDLPLITHGLVMFSYFTAWQLMTETLNPALKDTGPFVFVSYKSDNATAVRKVVEQLMSRGMNIWFAEHHVLLTNYERFQRAIDHAIAHSHHAIVFTNKAWAESPYVKEEMSQILAWDEPERVIEVRVPTRDGLIDVHTPREIYGEFTYHDPINLTAPDNCLTLLEEIEAIVAGEEEEVWHACPLPITSLMASGSFAMHAPTGYGIQVGPFTEDRTVFPKLDGSVGGWSWSIDLEDEKGQSEVKMLACMRRGLLSGVEIFEEEIYQDRRLYDMYRHHAKRWVATGFMRHMPIKTKGLHLIRPECSGTIAYDRCIPPAQFGLTYLTKMKNGLNSWERRYEYALPDSDGETWLELDLIFWLKLNPVSEGKEFRMFCQLTPLFDCIGESLVCRPELRQARGINEFVIEELESVPHTRGFS